MSAENDQLITRIFMGTMWTIMAIVFATIFVELGYSGPLSIIGGYAAAPAFLVAVYAAGTVAQVLFDALGLEADQ